MKQRLHQWLFMSLICLLAIASSCTCERRWAGPGAGDCDLQKGHAVLRASTHWPNTFGSTEGKAVGCLQVAWGTSPTQAATSLVQVSSGGAVVGWNSATKQFQGVPSVILPSAAKASSTRRFRIFTFVSTVADPSLQADICAGAMAAPDYDCLDIQQADTCWFYYAFRPNTPGADATPLPEGGECRIHSRTSGGSEISTEPGAELLTESGNEANPPDGSPDGTKPERPIVPDATPDSEPIVGPEATSESGRETNIPDASGPGCPSNPNRKLTNLFQILAFNANLYIFGVVHADDGRTFVTGTTTGSFNFGGTSFIHKTNRDSFIAEIKADGTHGWIVPITSARNVWARAIVLGPKQKFLYVVGEYQREVLIPNVQALSVSFNGKFAVDGKGIFAARIPVTGSTVGRRLIGLYPTQTNDSYIMALHGKPLLVTADGTLYVAGNFKGSACFGQTRPCLNAQTGPLAGSIFMLRTHPDFGGWRSVAFYNLGGVEARISRLVLNHTNSIFGVGYCSSFVQSGKVKGNTTNTRGVRSGLVVEFSEFGTTQRVKILSSADAQGYFELRGAAKGRAGELLVSGSFSRQFKLAGNIYDNPSPQKDFVVASIQMDTLQENWAAIGGSRGSGFAYASVLAAGRGLICISGHASPGAKLGSTNTFGGGANNKGEHAPYVTCLNEQGKFLWAVRPSVSGPTSGNTTLGLRQSLDIHINAKGHIAFAGVFDGALGFDAGTITSSLDAQSHTQDGFVAWLCGL